METNALYRRPSGLLARWSWRRKNHRKRRRYDGGFKAYIRHPEDGLFADMRRWFGRRPQLGRHRGLQGELRPYVREPGTYILLLQEYIRRGLLRLLRGF